MKLSWKLSHLAGLPFRLQALAAAGALTFMAVAGYAGLVLPQQRQIRILKAQLARLEPEPMAGREAVPPITADERKLWAALEARLQERFPTEKHLPDALRGVAELARSADMELLALNLHTPRTTPSGGPATPDAASVAAGPVASRVPPPLTASPTTIKLTVIHRYQNLVQFLDGLPSLPVFVAVESLETKRVENALVSEMTLRTLRWPSPDTR